jgi:cell division protease FtsH
MILWIIIPLVMIALFNLLEKRSGPETNISYTEFLDMVGAGEIRELVMQGQVIFGSAADGRRFKVFTPRRSLANMVKTSEPFALY